MSSNTKISTRQIMILLILLFCAPAVRYIPSYSSNVAHQAAWLSPFVAFVLLLIYMFVWLKFVEKYKQQSFIDIIKDILGKFAGNIVILIYWIWITIFLAYNVRMYAARILISALPNVSIFVITGIMLILVFYVVRDGIINLARMGEIFILLLAFVLVFYNIVLIPEMDIKNLYPITYKDIGGILMGTFPILSIFGYNVVLFFINDKVTYSPNSKKEAFKTVIILSVISLMVIISSLAVFGWNTIAKMPVPYINITMEISMFNVLERIESGLLMFWILTDFILISVFTYSAMHIIRNTFKIQDTNPLINIYLIFIFFLTVIFANSIVELEIFSKSILTPTNILIGYCLPIIIFIIGKLRKKV